MSVVSTSLRLTVRCDGRPRNKNCDNHYTLINDNEHMKLANEQLARWGWRTKIDGYVQLHFCPACSNRIAEFHPNMKVQSEPQKRATMSEDTRRKLSEKAKAREERRRAEI